MALPLTVVAQVWIKEVVIKDILSDWNKKSDLPKPGTARSHPAKSTKHSSIKQQVSESLSPKVVTTEITFPDKS